MRKLILLLCLLATPAAYAATYCVSAAGSDSNSGLAGSGNHCSTGSPWLHEPGMPNFTGSYTHAAGDQIIFRGGDTWHFGNSSDAPYSGGPMSWAHSGSSGTHDYLGVDVTWFTGSSWVRPVFNWDNPITTSFPSSCSFTTSAQAIAISASGATNTTIDNIEFTGYCSSTSSDANNFAYILVNTGASSNITISNSYFHGWSIAVAP